MKLKVKPNQVAVELSGDNACFAQYTSGINRYTSNIPTASALAGMLNSIYAHPHDKYDKDEDQSNRNLLEKPRKNFKWVIDKIYIQKPIKFYSYSYNARKDFSGEAKTGSGTSKIIPVTDIILQDVSYVVIAHPHIFEKRENNTYQKHVSIFNRRVKEGKCFHQPTFGLANYPASFKEVPEEIKVENINMLVYDYLLDMEYTEAGSVIPKRIPVIEVKNGIVDVEKCRKEEK